MTAKALLVPLFFLLTSLTGVFPQSPQEKCVKAGELVALQCPHDDAKLIWTSHTTQEMDLTKSAEQRQMGVLVHGRSLVILNASVNHQGNYSCSLRNSGIPFWFRLIVYKTKTRECEQRENYNDTCYAQEVCTLHCPDKNTPAANTPNITSNGIRWHKEGKPLPNAGYFSSVKKNDRGVYTCTRSYLYHGQIYNMTFTMELDVQPKKISKKPAMITEPRMGQVFPVDLGLEKVIDCKAVVYSKTDEVFWSLVDNNDKLPVFYNFTREPNHEEINWTASLVFKKVSEEDLSKNYTCKLESQSSSFVTITLAKKAQRSYVSLVLCVICVVVVMVFTVVIYMKFKINIFLFLRDTLGCHSSTSDGKSYDAFLMCYKSNTDTGLNEEDRNWLRSVLEETFDYCLCLNDRDVSPGLAVADAVLECIERSRTVVLVPTSPDPCPGSEVLSAIHEALVERQTRLVFIKTEATEVSKSGSLPEALQLLSEAGNSVTWKGTSSMPPSSSFWKQLRYYLPPGHSAPKIRLLPLPI
ncbi:interleukin-1 receptor accessory protein-like [Symphorus nematophorus]